MLVPLHSWCDKESLKEFRRRWWSLIECRRCAASSDVDVSAAPASISLRSVPIWAGRRSRLVDDACRIMISNNNRPVNAHRCAGRYAAVGGIMIIGRWPTGLVGPMVRRRCEQSPPPVAAAVAMLGRPALAYDVVPNDVRLLLVRCSEDVNAGPSFAYEKCNPSRASCL